MSLASFCTPTTQLFSRGGIPDVFPSSQQTEGILSLDVLYVHYDQEQISNQGRCAANLATQPAHTRLLADLGEKGML
jgi:hypothetical protein